jgi:flagellar biosynthetic protein FliQ
MDILMGHLGHGIWLILLLSMPATLLAAGIGLIVGILQAVTQVQEQTITAAPKIIGVFMLVIFGGPLMVDTLKDYILESTHLAMEVIPRDELMILPPKPRLAYGEANSRMDFFKERKPLFTENKVKTMMEQPSKISGANPSNNGPVSVSVTHPSIKPKAGVGEQIYMQRRASGTLPQPPNRRNGNP